MAGMEANFVVGVRAAAVRKLPHELGIPESQLKPEYFTYLTKIHYLAPSDGLWGEHESELPIPTGSQGHKLIKPS